MAVDKNGGTKLVVGLGNPGKEYEKTRHNAGFMAVDFFADQKGFKISTKKKKGYIGKFNLNGIPVVFLKPQTFMNLSGESVLYMASFLRVPPEDILVVFDDVEIPFGQIRIRKFGSSGGHNGMKSIISFLKTDNFPRIRIGIGKPFENIPLEDWVLSNFSIYEMEALKEKILPAVADAIELVVSGRINEAMSKYNNKDLIEDDEDDC